MARSEHIIHRQELQLRFYNGTAFAGLSGVLGTWLQESLVPAMEEVLDGLDLPSKLIRIDRLELDAGVIRSDNWQEALTTAVCALLRRRIPEAAASAPAGAASGESDRLELLLSYLRTGNLPWHAAAIPTTDVLTGLADLVAEGYFSRDAGLALLAAEPATLRRLLLQLRPAALESWFTRWNGAIMREALPPILHRAGRLFGDSRTALAWSYSLLFALLAQSGTAAASTNKCLCLVWFEEKNAAWGAGNGAATEQRHMAEATSRLLSGSLDIAGWTAATLAEKAAAALGAPAIPGAAEKVDAMPVAGRKVSHAEVASMEGWFIGNAGLVLLHPFLTAFMQTMGLLDDRQDWRDDGARRRGALLLHFLATGRTEAAEYELPLCKLLTGQPQEDPSECELEPTVAEAEEVTALLQHAVASWPLLKGTSPDGLRQTFLERDGKLSHVENGWLLQADQKGVDILLGQLPWGIGIVKTRWMKEPLFTEWA